MVIMNQTFLILIQGLSHNLHTLSGANSFILQTKCIYQRTRPEVSEADPQRNQRNQKLTEKASK